MQLIAFILTIFFRKLMQRKEGIASWIQNNIHLTLASIMCQMFDFGQIIYPSDLKITHTQEKMEPNFKTVTKIINHQISPWRSDRLTFLIRYGAMTWVVVV